MGSSETSSRHPLPPPGCSRSAYGTQMGAYGPVRLRRKSAIGNHYCPDFARPGGNSRPLEARPRGATAARPNAVPSAVTRLGIRCASPSWRCSFAPERHQQRASALDSVATQRCRPARAPRPPPLHTCRPTLPTQRACHGRATVGRHATLAREASVESGQGPPLPSHPDSCQLTDLHVTMSHVTQACTYPAHELALRLRQAARPAPKLD